MASSKLKLLYVLEILLRESDEDHPVDVDRILVHLQNHNIPCERKSIYSDVTALREYGYDIITKKGSSGGYALVSREFEDAELRLLCDAVQAAGFISPKKTRKLIDKLFTLTSAPQAKLLRGQVHVDNRPKSGNEEIYYHIDKLDRAIRGHVQVRALYRRRFLAPDNTVANSDVWHTVSPYALIWSDDHYYLIANKEKYSNLMPMRIDRIKKLEILPDKPARHFSEVSPYETSFDTADYAKRHFHMYSGTPEPIELVFDPDMLEQMLDRFGEDVRFRRSDTGKLILRTEAAVNDGFVAWLLQFGDKIYVKKPEELKARLFRKAQEVERVYKI